MRFREAELYTSIDDQLEAAGHMRTRASNLSVKEPSQIDDGTMRLSQQPAPSVVVQSSVVVDEIGQPVGLVDVDPQGRPSNFRMVSQGPTAGLTAPAGVSVVNMNDGGTTAEGRSSIGMVAVANPQLGMDPNWDNMYQHKVKLGNAGAAMPAAVLAQIQEGQAAPMQIMKPGMRPTYVTTKATYDKGPQVFKNAVGLNYVDIRENADLQQTQFEAIRAQIEKNKRG